MDKATNREIIKYEYRVISTPEYIADIEEYWEVYKVFSEGYKNITVVFRRNINKTYEK